MAAVSGATGGAAGGLSLELVDIVGAAGGVALAPGAGVGAAGGTTLAPGIGLVPGARAGAARMQAPKCRRQSSAVTYVLGSRATVAGGVTFALGALVVAASGIAPRASSVVAAVGTAPLRLLPRLGRPPGLIGVGVAAAAAAPRAAWWRCWSSHEREIRQSTAESPRTLAPAAPSRAVPRRGLAGSSRSPAGCLPKRPSGVLWPWAISSATVAWLAPAAASRTACRASRCCSAVPKIRSGPSCPRWGTSTATPTSRLSSPSAQPPAPNILPRSPAPKNISSQQRPPRP